MKRFEGDVDAAGHADEASGGRSSGSPRVGLTLLRGSADLRSNRPAPRDPVARALAETELIEDFLEFLEDASDCDETTLAMPDPLFRERLRRRLWRSLGFGWMRPVRDVH
jgi:hypothetical protein